MYIVYILYVLCMLMHDMTNYFYKSSKFQTCTKKVKQIGYLQWKFYIHMYKHYIASLYINVWVNDNAWYNVITICYIKYVYVYIYNTYI